jgi:hypothetical protein
MPRWPGAQIAVDLYNGLSGTYKWDAQTAWHTNVKRVSESRSGSTIRSAKSEAVNRKPLNMKATLTFDSCIGATDASFFTRNRISWRGLTGELRE